MVRDMTHHVLGKEGGGDGIPGAPGGRGRERGWSPPPTEELLGLRHSPENGKVSQTCGSHLPFHPDPLFQV